MVVSEGYSLRQHIYYVLTQFNKYFADKRLPAGLSAEVFRKILAVHDLGKSAWDKKGRKDDAYDYIIPAVKNIYHCSGLSTREITHCGGAYRW